MMILITCKECGKSGRLPFELKWEYKEHCKKCCTYDTMEYNFCSENCLFRFVERFVGHNHNWKWEIPKHQKFGNEICIESQICSICDMKRWKERK
jgi:hypothetical protein